ncbi:hypothetical protein HanXRQr2_Chr08g0350661 [Helianthus annuus]|uniref:Uncharacterized protein n=1 Tax=Helianthus annuus TaxID=4232 RepID=A0A9K3NEG0_HELAN|nr:hypothetical protein HanXRQr2_Chr08g0350661 [Helianthus annuus]KAJ0902592.1 hypothetical protein HanPSC8_Chr08g0338801 [Helianthus annuus]
MQNGHIVPNNRCLSDHNSRSMIKQQPASHFRSRMNIQSENLGYAVLDQKG